MASGAVARRAIVPPDLLERIEAGEAGRLLASFHAGVSDLDITLHTERLGVHDTARHLRRLEEALVEHAGHRYFARIEPLARKILAEAAALPTLPTLPDRLVHGDPRLRHRVDHAQIVPLCLHQRTQDLIGLVDLPGLRVRLRESRVRIRLVLEQANRLAVGIEGGHLDLA